MISYTFRVTFEDIDDVTRVIEILASQSFLDFHQAIQTAINFDGTKEASFYVATDNWRKGKEITNVDKAEIPKMSEAKLRDWIVDPHQKFIYVSDFDAEWTLLLELTKIQKSDATKQFPLLVKQTGEAPKQCENLNKYISNNSEFDTIAEDMIADRINDDETGMLEGEEGEDVPDEDLGDVSDDLSGDDI